jgi:hypothetical protein
MELTLANREKQTHDPPCTAIADEPKQKVLVKPDLESLARYFTVSPSAEPGGNPDLTNATLVPIEDGLLTACAALLSKLAALKELLQFNKIPYKKNIEESFMVRLKDRHERIIKKLQNLRRTT